ncbi:CPK1 [Symbiodinium sp. KB8]|nr:CPK1 [Symbiodinium sp. KB8]
MERWEESGSPGSSLSPPILPAVARRRTAAAFLLLDSPGEDEQALLTLCNQGHDDAQTVPGHKHRLASSFSGHGSHSDEAKAVAGDLGQFLHDPSKIADASAWAKLMTDVAVVANFGALILTFLGAAYHAYGYVQLRNAQKQASRSQGGGGGRWAEGYSYPGRGRSKLLLRFHGYVDFKDLAAHGEFTKAVERRHHDSIGNMRHLRSIFEEVRPITDAIHGKVIQYRWRAPHQEKLCEAKSQGQTPKSKVTQNRGRFTNVRTSLQQNPKHPDNPHPEDALTEIGVLSYLRHQSNVPVYLPGTQSLAHYAWRMNTHTLLVTEWVSDGELFNHVASGRLGTDEGVVRGLMWQLFHGTNFLHAHDIGHRDISLENVLVSFDRTRRDQYHLRLMDFGQAVRTRSACRSVFLRYFRPAGKPYYRGPEVYIPGENPQVHVRCPATAQGGDVVFVDNLKRDGRPDGYRNEVRLPPDAIPGQICLADTWGYEVPPLDVFALGVCFFILAWQVPPWSRALPLDATFMYVQQHGIPPLLNAWHKRHLSPEAMKLVKDMVAADPRQRPSVQDCLASAWLVPLRNDPAQSLKGLHCCVPTHPAAATEHGGAASSTVPADDMVTEMARMDLGAPQA